jgi:hypothetical protein
MLMERRTQTKTKETKVKTTKLACFGKVIFIIKKKM